MPSIIQPLLFQSTRHHGSSRTALRFEANPSQPQDANVLAGSRCSCQLGRTYLICGETAFSSPLMMLQTLGYDASVMNGLLILPSYTEYFNLNTATTGLNTAAMWMGSIIGCIIMQPIADYLGRRKAVMIAAIITAIGIVLQVCNNFFPQPHSQRFSGFHPQFGTCR